MSVDILLANSLFISQDPVERRIMEPYFPLGVLYLAAQLRQHGYRVAIFDSTFAEDERDFGRAIAEHRPRLVGISALVTTRRMALRLSRVAREAGVPVVMGGPDPTAVPERYLYPTEDGEGGAGADLVLVGEAEETILEAMPLLVGDAGTRGRGDAGRGAGVELPVVSASPRLPISAPPLAAVPGLAMRDSEGGVYRTAPRAYLADLDGLPFPAWDLLDVDRYQRVWREHHGYSSLSLITSRGCPFRCNWCAKPVFGRRFRQRSAENVAAEMRWLKTRYRPDQVRIVDDILGVNRKWLVEWHRAVLEADAAIPFECLSRVDLTDEATLSLFKELGCKMIFFGAESGSQRILDAMDKGITVEQTYAAARATRATGIKTYFYTMLGYPPEDLGDIRLTARMLRDCLPDRFSTTVAYPLPGTKFYEAVRAQLTREHDWVHSAENVVPFARSRYGPSFYKWVQRWLHKEVAVERLRRGLDSPPLGRRLRLRAELLVSRVVVCLLASLAGVRGQVPGVRVPEAA